MLALPLLPLLLATLITPSCHGLLGFDISLEQCNARYTSPEIWQCHRKEGKGFAVIEAVQGYHGVTTNIGACVQNARNNGFAVSLYGWFCPVCTGQADGYLAAKNALLQIRQQQGLVPGVNFTYFYVDVEDCDPDDDCWQTPQQNQQYVLNLVEGVRAAGATPAIYVSSYEWKLLFGMLDPVGNLSSLPLWWPHWDGNPTLSGFEPFAGFQSMHMKQYADSEPASSCDSEIDLDYID
jgi:GH25 family lysozyme M1 (1,4-beta-N-acetylmuramidase)